MMVAGEASGDQYGADLYRALLKRYDSLECRAMGGPAMRNAGVAIIADSTRLGVMGLWDVLIRYIPIRLALSRVYKNLETFSPQLLICIDYKEFNFLVARRAKSLGIKVLFYIGPQVWAWRPGRVRKYGEIIDMMAVILPFEIDIYRQHSIPAQYVGHPLMRSVKVDKDKRQALSEAGLHTAFPIIGLLPGSRHNEVKRLLPVMLEAAELLISVYPHAQFILPKANNIDCQMIEDYLRVCSVNVHQCRAGDYDLLQNCDIAVSASGTATLELALLAIPIVIVYKMAPISYWVAKCLVKIPYIGLPNIILGRCLVPELIQDRANAALICETTRSILDDYERADQIRKELTELRRNLGDLNGIELMADLIDEMLSPVDE